MGKSKPEPKEKSKLKEKPIKNYLKSKMKTQMSLPKSHYLGGHGGLEIMVDIRHAGTGTTTPGLIKVDSIHIIEPGRNGAVSITEDGLLITQQSEDLQPRIKLTNIISLS